MSESDTYLSPGPLLVDIVRYIYISREWPKELLAIRMFCSK